jgi:predicted nucleic acid-binding protein
MAVDRFLYTNILFYAHDLGAPKKRGIALGIVEESWRHPARTAVSVQVLQEFHVNFVRQGHSGAEADLLAGDFSNLNVVDNTLELFRRGLEIQRRRGLSMWDAMILSAAQASGARELLSEDFNHGQDYGGVRVLNPFHAPG